MYVPSMDSLQNNNAVEQIEKLFELNQKGILTDEEFKVKKEELLKKYEYIIWAENKICLLYNNHRVLF